MQANELKTIYEIDIYMNHLEEYQAVYCDTFLSNIFGRYFTKGKNSFHNAPFVIEFIFVESFCLRW